MLQGLSRHIALMHYAGPPTIGGVESVIRHHADLLADAGHHVSIVTGRAQSWRDDVEIRTIDQIDSLHPDVLALKTELDQGKVPQSFETLVDELAQHLRAAFSDVDTVIAHNICTMAKNLALSKALRVVCAETQGPRLIAWHHDLAWTAARYKDELHEGYPWSLLLEPWTDTNVTHVAVSQMRKEELSTLQGINPEEVKVVPSGVTTEDFYSLDPCSTRLINDNKLDRHYPIFLLPVRITKRKNIEYAQEIIAELRSNFPNCALIVTGPPGAHNTNNTSYFEQLKQLRTALALEPDKTKSPSAAVYFLAELSKQRLADETIASFFRFCDALLIPSAEEGFGIPIIEAGLSAMPIFCSDIAPFREIAETNATFFSIEQSAKDTAICISHVIQNDARLKLRNRVRNEYSWQAIFRNKITPLILSTDATKASDLKQSSSKAPNSDNALNAKATVNMKEIR